MDTTDPQITFDERGNCCHCTAYLDARARHTYRGRESESALESIIDQIKHSGRGNEYDCVVGVSGGADSSYLLYIAVKKGLRPLTVHMDNGWNSDKAVLNINNVTRKLGVDYESYVLDWDEFRELQLAFLKASIPEAETPTDIAIPAALHQIAAKHGVKYILSGGNLATEGILPRSWHYDARDLKYFNYIQRTFGRKKVRNFPTFGYRKEMYYKLVRGIRMAYPLDLVSYVKADATKLLSEEFDWKPYGGKHHESRYTKFIQSYYLREKFGIDYRRATLSSRICAGEIDREYAVEQLRAEPYEHADIENDKQFISKKLGISIEEFESILDRPPKWNWDYPNDQRKLGLIYKAYRWLLRSESLNRF